VAVCVYSEYTSVWSAEDDDAAVYQEDDDDDDSMWRVTPLTEVSTDEVEDDVMLGCHWLAVCTTVSDPQYIASCL